MARKRKPGQRHDRSTGGEPSRVGVSQQGKENYSRFNENYTYIRSKQLEGTSPFDLQTGAWPITTWRILYGWGQVTEADWPRMPLPENPLAAMPDGIDQVAKKLRLRHYQRVLTLDECKRAIHSYSPPLVSIRATEDWFDAENGVIPDPSSETPFVGVHAVPLLGYSDKDGMLDFVNSWGKEWGKEGSGKLSYQYYDTFSIEAWLASTGDGTRNLALETTRASPADVHRFTQPLELMWGIRDVLRPGVFHCREIYNLADDERMAWAFAVLRGGFLDIEEFFVRPQYRRQRLGVRLAKMLIDLSTLTGCPLRLWVSFADCGEENRPALDAVLIYLGLTLRNTPHRWAAYAATPGVSSKPLLPIVIPERPTLSRGTRRAAAAFLASSIGLGSTDEPSISEVSTIPVSSAPRVASASTESNAREGESSNEAGEVINDRDHQDCESSALPPNEKALATLKAVSEKRKHSALTEPGNSLKYLREARSGGMYGFVESEICDD